MLTILCRQFQKFYKFNKTPQSAFSKTNSPLTYLSEKYSLKKFKIGICQQNVSREHSQTLKFIKDAIEEAANNQAKMVVLGETFNCFYNKESCTNRAENFNSQETPTLSLIKDLAKKHKIYIIGSIPETNDQKQLFNTAIVVDKNGNLQTTFRKLHLFDINIPGKITYKESDTFSPGNSICVVDTEYCKIGVGICYDLRFPEQALVMAQEGAQVLIYPGAFNLTTGPLHYELLLRSRALDNLCYVVGACVARFTEDTSIYQAWGHSSLISPWGEVLAKADEKSTILYGEIDLEFQDQKRQQIPIYNQKRNDIYEIIHKQKKN